MKLRTTGYDSAVVLDTPEAVQEYLADAFESEDAALIAHALGVVARAVGMTKLAEQTGLTRPALYKALSSDGNPEFGTVLKVAHALGFRLSPERLPENGPGHAAPPERELA
ncbi:addiction module antidote protein [uncultured Brevundimonas sp.]|uniref:addiction module antidote protein n=1 Tax=uncultured Brevundimonas sp. TaxID=213418 RepID=UPI0030EDE6CD|tara:strand:- start:658 stop:990 length:333 start_codon:yes stop_codon:yes gene_type:complete